MRPTTIFAILAILLVPTLAQGDIPQFMSYQGVLRDASGNPVSDGSYDVEFNLYDVETGGTSLWTETHVLVAADGIIEAPIGSITPLSPLSFEVPYWLGISVEGEAELVPRTALATAPYAGRAGSAESCDNVDDHDWEVDGDDLYRGVGNVGIGSVSPATRLHVVTGSEPCARFEGGGTNFDFNIRSMNSAGTAGAFFSGTGATSAPLTPAAVYGVGGAGSQGAQFSSEGTHALSAFSANGRAVWGRSSGNYAGYFDGGGWGVYVDDQLETNSFRMQPGAAYGYVLTSSSGGEGTWQPAAAIADADWTTSGVDMYSGVTGDVGIGDSTPTSKLTIYNDAYTPALDVRNNYWSAGRVANFEWATGATSSSDILQLEAGAGGADDCQFIECERGTVIEFAVDGDGYLDSNGGAEFGDDVSVTGVLTVTGDSQTVGDFRSSAASNNAEVLSGISTAVGSIDPTGVYGESVPAEGFGIGGEFLGGWRGVMGTVNQDGSASYRAVYGYAAGASYTYTGSNYGVYGQASFGATNYGVYGTANNGTTSWAGYFNGDTHVVSTFTAGSKLFKIDHPLDPENKYLQHSCVESDEMMNIYNGNVTLDGRGEAVVEMPEWFEALNQDFRYQLTAIGAPGPNLYVAEKLSGNAFRIAGGEPGSEVSWQVTGVRHDALAVASRMSVEVDKSAAEAGKYMHPEAFGMPLTAGVNYHNEREVVSEPHSRERAPLPVRNRNEADGE